MVMQEKVYSSPREEILKKFRDEHPIQFIKYSYHLWKINKSNSMYASLEIEELNRRFGLEKLNNYM